MQRRNRLARESRCRFSLFLCGAGKKTAAFRENRPLPLPLCNRAREWGSNRRRFFFCSSRCYLRTGCCCSEPFVVLAITMRDVVNEETFFLLYFEWVVAEFEFFEMPDVVYGCMIIMIQWAHTEKKDKIKQFWISLVLLIYCWRLHFYLLLWIIILI